MYQQASKDLNKELIDKSYLIYIFTSKCKYHPKASLALVKKQKVTDEQNKTNIKL